MSLPDEPPGQADRTEGDINLSDHRLAWQQANVNDATRETLERDSAAFLHQSLSTPCLTELTGCDGMYLTDADGRHRSFSRRGDTPLVEVDDPMGAHRDMLPLYGDADIHNVTAYLVTLQ